MEKTIYVDESCTGEWTERSAVTIGAEGLSIQGEYSKDGGETWRTWQDQGASISLKGLAAIFGEVKAALAVYGEESEPDA